MRDLKRRVPKPRNPLVAPSLQRKAGTHQKSRKHERLKAQADLRREQSKLH